MHVREIRHQKRVHSEGLCQKGKFPTMGKETPQSEPRNRAATGHTKKKKKERKKTKRKKKNKEQQGRRNKKGKKNRQKKPHKNTYCPKKKEPRPTTHSPHTRRKNRCGRGGVGGPGGGASLLGLGGGQRCAVCVPSSLPAYLQCCSAKGKKQKQRTLRSRAKRLARKKNWQDGLLKGTGSQPRGAGGKKKKKRPPTPLKTDKKTRGGDQGNTPDPKGCRDPRVKRHKEEKPAAKKGRVLTKKASSINRSYKKKRMMKLEKKNREKKELKLRGEAKKETGRVSVKRRNAGVGVTSHLHRESSGKPMWTGPLWCANGPRTQNAGPPPGAASTGILPRKTKKKKKISTFGRGGKAKLVILRRSGGVFTKKWKTPT